MKVRELIRLLKELDSNAKVVLEDLNGLQWDMEPDLLYADETGDVIITTLNINEV